MTRARTTGGFAALVALAALGACERGSQNLSQLAGGDPRRGKEAIRTYGCGSCHTIPGIRGADGQVGPPLQGIAQRVYVAGVLTNTPENLVRWIQDPKKIDSLTAMPNLGVTEAEARDIAAFLYAQR